MFSSGSHGDARTGQALSGRVTKVRVTRAEHRELVQELSSFKAFANCTRDDLDALVDAGRPFTLPAYWALMSEGDSAGGFYAITHGDARVFSGRKQIAEVHAGEIVGEMSVLSGRPRRATVTSSSRLAGLRVGTDHMTELFASHPRLLEALKSTYEAHTAGQKQAVSS
jgi:CRP-like cAMP-binding protein